MSVADDSGRDSCSGVEDRVISMASAQGQPARTIRFQLIPADPQIKLSGDTSKLPTDLPTASLALDACIVPSAASPAGARLSDARALVLDDFIPDSVRSALLEALIGNSATEDLIKGNLPSAPADLWERRTADSAGATPTWGLKAEPLRALMSGKGVPAMRYVGSRLCSLFPAADVAWLPSDAIQMPEHDSSSREGRHSVDCAALLANAAVPGDSYSYHQDADPTSFPDSSEWCAAFGDYFNGEAGKPLLVSLVLYLNPEWRRDWGGETLLLDGDTGVGVAVLPRPGRALLMHQDIVHRLVAPNPSASGHPRFSLVWKLALLPKVGSGTADLSRSHVWGEPTPFVSVARLEAVKASMAREVRLRKRKDRLEDLTAEDGASVDS